MASKYAEFIPRRLRSEDLTLSEKQQLFTLLWGVLLVAGSMLGEKAKPKQLVVCGETQRGKAQAAANAAAGIGIKNSLHIKKLAGDLLLFELKADGRKTRYLTKREDYKVWGDVWTSWHPLARWGGNWKRKQDGAHFSITHGGKQ